MLEIQTAVLDLMNFTLKELKLINQTVSDINVIHIEHVTVLLWYHVHCVTHKILNQWTDNHETKCGHHATLGHHVTVLYLSIY
jgi:hypothetical protein